MDSQEITRRATEFSLVYNSWQVEHWDHWERSDAAQDYRDAASSLYYVLQTLADETAAEESPFSGVLSEKINELACELNSYGR